MAHGVEVTQTADLAQSVRSSVACDHPDHDHAARDPHECHRNVDTTYNGRRPTLLAGNPHTSWLWSRPTIRLRATCAGQPSRNPGTSPTLAASVDLLEGDESDQDQIARARRAGPDLQRRVRANMARGRAERPR